MKGIAVEIRKKRAFGRKEILERADEMS